MEEIIKIDVHDSIYHHIRTAIEVNRRANNNIAVMMNRFTLMWIITLIVWWFK